MQYAFEESGDRGWTDEIFLGFPDPGCPNPRYAKLNVFEDFHLDVADTVDSWIVDSLTDGTFTGDATAADIGVVKADSGGTTDDRGVQAQRAGHYFQLSTTNTVAFEVRVKASAIGTAGNYFIGAAGVDTTLIAADETLTAADSLGWLGLGTNALSFVSEDGTRDTEASVHTLVADAYVKLGVRVEKKAKVTLWVNGAKIANTLDVASLPDAILVPSIVCHTNGTTQPILHWDWYHLAVSVG
jgi:hypothetical protein